MHYKKNVKNSSDPPDWRYWNVFEEYMASRPNPVESDFMNDDSQGKQLIFNINTTTILIFLSISNRKYNFRIR